MGKVTRPGFQLGRYHAKISPFPEGKGALAASALAASWSAGVAGRGYVSHLHTPPPTYRPLRTIHQQHVGSKKGVNIMPVNGMASVNTGKVRGRKLTKDAA